MLITLAWLALALVHAPPALATFSSGLRQRMYGVDETGPLGVILIHRGALFLAVACVCVLAASNSDARAAALLVTSISLLGFLITYVTAGTPKRLRTIAIVDVIALIPLVLVGADVWAKLSA